MERRLYRSPQGKMLGGVCTGLAEYFDIDPVLVRLVFLILIFQHGVGLLAYVVLWIAVPLKRDFAHAVATADDAGRQDEAAMQSPSAGIEMETGKRPGLRSSLIGGIVLIVIGTMFLLDNFLPGFDFADFWPLLLIAVGTGMLWHSWPRESMDEEVAQ